MTRQASRSARFLRSGSGMFVALCVLLAGGCASSPRVVESWKDPALSGPLRFKKVVVMAIHPDVYARQDAERELVQQIGADRAIPAGQVLTNADRADVEKVKAKMKDSGADGVVVLSIAGTTTHTASPRDTNPYSYETFWNNYDNDIGAPDRDAGGSYSQRVIRFRTRIFSVADQKLIWDGISESVDPRDAKAVVSDVVKAVSKRLREERLIE